MHWNTFWRRIFIFIHLRFHKIFINLSSMRRRNTKEMTCLKISFFIMSVQKKSIQISKYSFLIGRHSNLDWFFTRWHDKKVTLKQDTPHYSTVKELKSFLLLYFLKSRVSFSSFVCCEIKWWRAQLSRSYNHEFNDSIESNKECLQHQNIQPPTSSTHCFEFWGSSIEKTQ